MGYFKDQSILDENSKEEEYGCKFCWDKRTEKEKELTFFDAANNIRICNYCPWCGRKYKGV